MSTFPTADEVVSLTHKVQRSAQVRVLRLHQWGDKRQFRLGYTLDEIAPTKKSVPPRSNNNLHTTVARGSWPSPLLNILHYVFLIKPFSGLVFVCLDAIMLTWIPYWRTSSCLPRRPAPGSAGLLVVRL